MRDGARPVDWTALPPLALLHLLRAGCDVEDLAPPSEADYVAATAHWRREPAVLPPPVRRVPLLALGAAPCRAAVAQPAVRASLPRPVGCWPSTAGNAARCAAAPPAHAAPRARRGRLHFSGPAAPGRWPAAQRAEQLAGGRSPAVGCRGSARRGRRRAHAAERAVVGVRRADVHVCCPRNARLGVRRCLAAPCACT